MPIPSTLVWFGVLGPQNRAPNSCDCSGNIDGAIEQIRFSTTSLRKEI